MKKVLIKSILTLCVTTVIIFSIPFTSLAYTQDDCMAAWDELDKKYGINSKDVYVGACIQRLSHII